MKRLILAALILRASAASGQSLPQVDGPRDITCFSGGKEIFKGRSDPTYPVLLGAQDDHVLFVDADTRQLTRVGGNCVVRWTKQVR